MARIEGSRPDSHRIGDLAEAQIATLFTSQGSIVNPAIKDYGEDLIVQVYKEGRIFPFHIYVQVKGTNDLNRFERTKFFSYSRFRRDTVRRWLDSSEPVLIILWDVNSEVGAYGFATELFDPMDIGDGTSEYITGRIEKDSILDDKSAKSVGMQAVLDWAVGQCRAAKGTATLAQESHAGQEYAQHKLATVGLWVLLGLELVYVEQESPDPIYNIRPIDRERMGNQFIKKIRERNGGRRRSRASFREIVNEAIMETLIIELVGECYNRSGWGIEQSILEVTAPVFEKIFIGDDLRNIIVESLVETGGKI